MYYLCSIKRVDLLVISFILFALFCITTAVSFGSNLLLFIGLNIIFLIVLAALVIVAPTSLKRGCIAQGNEMEIKGNFILFNLIGFIQEGKTVYAILRDDEGKGIWKFTESEWRVKDPKPNQKVCVFRNHIYVYVQNYESKSS